MESRKTNTSKGMLIFAMSGLILVMMIAIGCVAVRQINDWQNASPVELQSDIEKFTQRVLAKGGSKDRVVEEFMNSGYSIRHDNNGDFLAYRKSRSGKKHFSVLIREKKDGFECVEIKTMGIGM